METEVSLADAKVALQTAIDKAKSYNISELADAIAAAEAALSAEDATIESLTAAEQALGAAVKDYVEITLTKIIKLANQLRSNELEETAIAIALTIMREDATSEELMNYLQTLVEKTISVAMNLLDMADEFAVKYGYADLAASIAIAKTVVATGNIDQIQATFNSLAIDALNPVKDALGKMAGYAETMGSEELTAAIAKALGDLNSLNISAVIADMQSITTIFLTTAQQFIAMVKAIDTTGKNNAEELAAALYEAEMTLTTEGSTIVTIGDAIRKLVAVYTAYREANSNLTKCLL